MESSGTVRVWAIADTHLSFARPKPMDIFGPQWSGHPEKILSNARKVVSPGDVLMIAGDISWAMRRREAELDLAFLAQIPGTKILIKGNHDYWWDSDKPLSYPGLCDTPFRSDGGLIGVAGTRGWDDLPEAPSEPELLVHNRHVTRELGRLEKRLAAIAGCQHKFAMTHYPPLPEFAPLLLASGVEAVVYGHMHLGGRDARLLPERWLGVRCLCVAADRIGFMPRLIATVEGTARPAPATPEASER